MTQTYTEADQEKAQQMARRGFFGACAALVAVAVAPERVYSFPQPTNTETEIVNLAFTSIVIGLDGKLFARWSTGDGTIHESVGETVGNVTRFTGLDCTIIGQPIVLPDVVLPATVLVARELKHL